MKAHEHPQGQVAEALQGILTDEKRIYAGGRSVLIDWAIVGDDIASSIVQTTLLDEYAPCVSPLAMEGILMSLTPRSALLLRLENALLETSRHLGIIERQIQARAERMTITSCTKRRQFGRGTSRWTRAGKRAFRENIAVLALTRRAEIDALIRKLTRQESAIAAFRRRHGIEPALGDRKATTRAMTIDG